MPTASCVLGKCTPSGRFTNDDDDTVRRKIHFPFSNTVLRISRLSEGWLEYSLWTGQLSMVESFNWFYSDCPSGRLKVTLTRIELHLFGRQNNCDLIIGVDMVCPLLLVASLTQIPRPVSLCWRSSQGK